MMIRVRGLLTITAVSVTLILPAVMSMAQPLDLAVMTQNLYLGADTTPILTAKTLPEFQAAIIAARDSIVATNFPLRAEAISSEVAAGRPLLIGLQESEIVSESDVPQSLNYADTLIAALKGHGLNYTYRIPGLEDAVHTGFVLEFGGGWHPQPTLYPHRSGSRTGTKRCCEFYGQEHFSADIRERRDRIYADRSVLSQAPLRAGGRIPRWRAVSISSPRILLKLTIYRNPPRLAEF